VRALHNLTFLLTSRKVATVASPDFVYERSSLWGISGVALARIRNVPLVLEVNAPLAEEQQRYRGVTLPGLARALEQWVWRRADVIIVVSDLLARHLVEVGVQAERVNVLPNAVDLRQFEMVRPTAGTQDNARASGFPVVGFIGTFKQWHGVDSLLVAFAQLRLAHKDAQLLLVGDGPLRDSLKDDVARLGLQASVTFAGSISHGEIPRALANIDIAVAPYPDIDGFYFSPLKIFEYMAAGRAIIASSVGQIAKVLRHEEQALLFTPGDTSELVLCLDRLARDPVLRDRLGRNARDTVRQYTWTNNVSRILSLVEAAQRARRYGRRGKHYPAISAERN
jgi:glycosyltransferase involved in cell wall biosynthesis